MPGTWGRELHPWSPSPPAAEHSSHPVLLPGPFPPILRVCEHATQNQVSVVEVEMAGDNKVAKVLVSAVGSEAEKKACVQWLQAPSCPSPRLRPDLYLCSV